MTDYKIGSLGSLISGKGNETGGTKIVYEKVSPRPNPARVTKQSFDGRLSPKAKRVSTLRERGRKLKDKITSPFVSKKKPEIAGDDVSGPVGQSWRPTSNLDESMEVDGVPCKEYGSFARNAARRIHIKKNTKKHVDDPEREARTVFVGNVPYAHAKKKKVVKFFSKYGDVESVRFRCAPLKDPRMPKKVAVIKHEFHPERSSICAFVVFKTHAAAKSALEANGALYHDHHLRVDVVGKALKDREPKKSVFIGNLAFSAEEEQLWELFSKCGPISSVRIVRDPITAVSKGIAFVNFESSDSAELALQLDESVIKKRKISVRRHRPSTEDSSVEKPVRHKDTKQSESSSKEKEAVKEKVRMDKKEKRRLRREGEKMLGIVKKKKNKSNDREAEIESELRSKPIEEGAETSEVKVKKPEAPRIGSKKVKFQGQTVGESKGKKKKVNKGELKKKKVADMLGASLQKKKKKSTK